MAETKFEVSVPDAELDDAQWKYGAPLADVKRLVDRWRNGYDWRRHERDINDELPMFTRDVDVDGFGVLNIHYVHKNSDLSNAIPLLYIHGARKLLRDQKVTPSTDNRIVRPPVVALGLPGYGFSEAPRKQGFALKQYAEVAHKLMLPLGYDDYVTQSGDLGYFVTRQMAMDYGGKHHKAWHTNMPLALPPSPLKEPLSFLSFLVKPLTAKEKIGLARTQWFQNQGSGYLAEQCTQPQTLGYSLVDSPVGLLAWVYEKLHNWTDNYPWDDDEILTWISIYSFSRAGPAASLRMYFEITNGQSTSPVPFQYPTIPMGFSLFPKDLFVFPKAWIRRGNRVVAEFEHDSGGHFAAYERPNELASDLYKMFGKGGGAYGVVPGKDGYA